MVCGFSVLRNGLRPPASLLRTQARPWARALAGNQNTHFRKDAAHCVSHSVLEQVIWHAVYGISLGVRGARGSRTASRSSVYSGETFFHLCLAVG